MRLQVTYGGREVQRFALEPGPCGADWPEVAYEGEVVLIHEEEPSRIRFALSPCADARYCRELTQAKASERMETARSEGFVV